VIETYSSASPASFHARVVICTLEYFESSYVVPDFCLTMT
jgi:hypothetical protein